MRNSIGSCYTLDGVSANRARAIGTPSVHSFVGRNSPNPFSGTTAFEIFVERPADVTIEVFDTTGRRVWQSIRSAPTGRYVYLFDGRDATGRALPSGVYYYRVTTGALQESRRMVILR